MMHVKAHKNHLSILAFIIIWVSCGLTNEEIEKQAKMVYEQRLADLRAKKMKECLLEAVRIAETEVDSILALEARNPLGDTLYRPGVPERPNFIPIDSTVLKSKRSVKPILQGS